MVRTTDLLASEPALADSLGLRAPPAADALTAVEQDPVPDGVALDEWLAGIAWPDEVLGCAIAYFVATRDRSIYRYIEPFWMFGGISIMPWRRC